MIENIIRYLTQEIDETVSFDESVRELTALFK